MSSQFGFRISRSRTPCVAPLRRGRGVPAGRCPGGERWSTGGWSSPKASTPPDSLGSTLALLRNLQSGSAERGSGAGPPHSSLQVVVHRVAEAVVHPLSRARFRVKIRFRRRLEAAEDLAMGAWGELAFDNDSANDWAYSLDEADDLAPVE